MNSHRQYGDLLITLTSQYELRYLDAGSGAHWNGTFWHPKADGDFRALGSVCVGGHADINSHRASMLLANVPGGTALAAPLDYAWVWDDHGSGAKKNCAVWRPVPPKGYVALGDVATSSYLKPSVNDIWCVRQDLVARGAFTPVPAWRDAGSGGRHNIAAWPVEVDEPSIDPRMGVLAPDTFVGVATYHLRPDESLARVVQVPILAEFGEMPADPVLESHREPRDPISRVKDCSVTLPFTALFDRTDRSSLKGIENPFYTVERWATWSLVCFNENRTTSSQTVLESVTIGITKSESDSFAIGAGLKFGLDTKVSLLTTFKIELSAQFNYTKSSSTSVTSSKTVTRSLVTPPRASAALWTLTHAFRVARADGSIVGPNLEFDVDRIVHAQYPPITPDIQEATVATAVVAG